MLAGYAGLHDTESIDSTRLKRISVEAFMMKIHLNCE
jgi:hypothetical protein